MKNRPFKLIIASIVLLVSSCIPMFYIVREFWIEKKVTDTYEIHHAYKDKDGFEMTLDSQEIDINNINIKIKEETTSRFAPLTSWDKDENVPPGEIVKIHILLNGKEVSTPDEIWLSNRQRGGRYFSWLDVLTVRNKITKLEKIYFVQRLTDDDHPMQKRQWKIISIDKDGSIKEQKMNYNQRSKNHLNVELMVLALLAIM